jgi:hypothetical protein
MRLGITLTELDIYLTIFALISTIGIFYEPIAVISLCLADISTKFPTKSRRVRESHGIFPVTLVAAKWQG